MKKIDIELAVELLHEMDLDPALIQKIARQYTQAAESAAQEAAETREPKSRKQWVILVSDPEGKLNGLDLVGWVTQIPEDESPDSAVGKIVAGAYSFNATRRGQKYPVKSIGEACECVGAKFFKEQNVAVKTKLPVLLVATDNRIPRLQD